jgi:cytochrome c peroxidase
MAMFLLSSASPLALLPGAAPVRTVTTCTIEPCVMSAAQPSRRAAIGAAAAAIGTSLLPAHAAYTPSEVDYSAVASELHAIIKADPDLGPTMLRLAWHSSGTFDKISKTGGSQGGTIRFKEELAHGGNAGLSKMVATLEPIKKRHPDISYADMYTLAGKVAIEDAGGPAIDWRAGRVDEQVEAVTPDGRLPNADTGHGQAANAHHLRHDVFYRMGFNDRDIVALSGAHALGRAHKDASGYSGPWTPTPYLLNTNFFNLLIHEKWTKKVWDGPEQYEDPSGKLMMLPSDLALVDDPKFKKYVVMYAADEQLFRKDFAKAASKLFALGTKDLQAVPVVWEGAASTDTARVALNGFNREASSFGNMVGAAFGLAGGFGLVSFGLAKSNEPPDACILFEGEEVCGPANYDGTCVLSGGSWVCA